MTGRLALRGTNHFLPIEAVHFFTLITLCFFGTLTSRKNPVGTQRESRQYLYTLIQIGLHSSTTWKLTNQMETSDCGLTSSQFNCTYLMHDMYIITSCFWYRNILQDMLHGKFLPLIQLKSLSSCFKNDRLSFYCHKLVFPFDTQEIFQTKSPLKLT